MDLRNKANVFCQLRKFVFMFLSSTNILPDVGINSPVKRLLKYFPEPLGPKIQQHDFFNFNRKIENFRFILKTEINLWNLIFLNIFFC